jgi:hypothetical protein
METVGQKEKVMNSFLNILFMAEIQGIGILFNIGEINLIIKFLNNKFLI